MAYTLKDGQGSLWKNEQKQNPEDRDYQGSLRVDGKDFWISGFVKTSKAGKKWLSLSARIKLTEGAIARKEQISEGEPPWD